MKKIDIHIHPVADDPQMDAYLSTMDSHEVEAALVHGLYLEGLDNTAVLRAVKAHPDRLFGSVYVDLLKPVEECIDLVRRYGGEGFKSVKVFPNFGFDPGEQKYEPFWQVVEDLGLMCLSHCGWLRPMGRQRINSRTASPLYFEIPARMHPGINFVMGHFGGGATYLETLTYTSRMENVFADTCPGWGQWVFQHRMPGLEGLNFEKVLYGTDNAGERYSQDEQWWTQTLFSMGKCNEDIQRYFYANAAKLLGIV